MKKLLFVLFISLIYCLCCQSQEKTYLVKKHFISFGYGYKLDTKWWKDEIEKINFDPPKTTNDLYLKYEYKLNKNIGIGLDLGFMNVDKDEFGIFAPLFETSAYTAKAIRILPSVNYHILNSSKFDPYINIEAGYYIMKTQLIHYYPDPNPLNSLGFLPSPLIRETVKKSKTNGFDFSAGIGMRYFFSKNFGIFGEAGINKSIFQTGLVVKF
jgi:hypothetical protein